MEAGRGGAKEGRERVGVLLKMEEGGSEGECAGRKVPHGVGRKESV